MITRFVRNRSYLYDRLRGGVALMALHYMQFDAAWVGHITARWSFPTAAVSTVQQRDLSRRPGGQVTEGRPLHKGGSDVVMNTFRRSREPACHIASVSAIGEQYVNLQPHNDSGRS